MEVLSKPSLSKLINNPTTSEPDLTREKLLKPKICLCKISKKDHPLSKYSSTKLLKKILKATKLKSISMLTVLTSPYFIHYISYVIANYIKCTKNCENSVFRYVLEPLVEIIKDIRVDFKIKIGKNLAGNHTKSKLSEQMCVTSITRDATTSTPIKASEAATTAARAALTDLTISKDSVTDASPDSSLEVRINLLIPNIMNILFEKRLPSSNFNKEKLRDILLLFAGDEGTFNDEAKSQFSRNGVNEYLKKCASKGICKLIKELYIFD